MADNGSGGSILNIGFLLNFIGLIFDKWVTTDTESWGILKHCVTKSKAQSCDYLPAGSTPGYYEAIRAVCWICYVMMVVVLGTVFMAPQIGIIIILLYLASALTPPVLLLTFYKDDDRWKDSDPSLGVSFGLFWAAFAVHFLFCILIIYHYVTNPSDPPWCKTVARFCCTPSCIRDCCSQCVYSVSRCCRSMRHGCTRCKESVSACCTRCKESVTACCTRCKESVTACCTRCKESVTACCTRCKKSVTACCTRCKESVTACCTRCKESVAACCTRCVETVVTCGTRCSAGLSSCCQGLAAKARLLLQGLGGLLAACCAPCRRGPSKAAGRPSPQDKQRRPHQQRVVLSKEQVWLLLKTLAHSKAATSQQTTAQCYHGDKAGFHGDVGCNDGHSESGTEREWDRSRVEDHGRIKQFPKPEQNVWHTGASSIPEWTQRGVQRQWVVNGYPETEQRMGHTDYRTKPKCDQTGIEGQWNINAGTTHKFLHTANSTDPEWYPGNAERKWNRNQNPKTEHKLWQRGNVPMPEWCPRNVERQWKQDQCPKAEQKLWHTEVRTKPECGHPSLSDLADPRVGWSLPDDVSESFV